LGLDKAMVERDLTEGVLENLQTISIPFPATNSVPENLLDPLDNPWPHLFRGEQRHLSGLLVVCLSQSYNKRCEK
jgi:hypothetical protein